jgi:hypothetical protein
MRFRHTRVKTFDSSRHPGQPVWFEFEGRGLEIEAVLERWSEAYQDPSFFPTSTTRSKLRIGTCTS